MPRSFLLYRAAQGARPVACVASGRDTSSRKTVECRPAAKLHRTRRIVERRELEHRDRTDWSERTALALKSTTRNTGAHIEKLEGPDSKAQAQQIVLYVRQHTERVIASDPRWVLIAIAKSLVSANQHCLDSKCLGELKTDRLVAIPFANQCRSADCAPMRLRKEGSSPMGDVFVKIRNH